MQDDTHTIETNYSYILRHGQEVQLRERLSNGKAGIRVLAMDAVLDRGMHAQTEHCFVCAKDIKLSYSSAGS